MTTAKLFWDGRSQVVSLPPEFRFDGTEVRIRRDGEQVILEPIKRNWDWLDKLEPLDDDAVAAIRKPVPQQERPKLDKAFE